MSQKPHKTIAMIPARYEATRFPGKLMQDLNGKTVIRRTYEAAVNTQLFDEVYVVTDNNSIFAEIENFGGKAIKSNKEHQCGSDRIAEAVLDMEVDIVLNIQGDEPLIERESLAKLLKVFKDDDSESIDLASLKSPMHDSDEITDPNNVKVITNKNNFALYFSRFPIPYPRNTNVRTAYYRHIGVYAFRKQALVDFYNLPMMPLEASENIEAIRYLEYGKNIKMVETDTKVVGIDTPEDLEKVKEMMGGSSVQ